MLTHKRSACIPTTAARSPVSKTLLQRSFKENREITNPTEHLRLLNMELASYSRFNTHDGSLSCVKTHCAAVLGASVWALVCRYGAVASKRGSYTPRQVLRSLSTAPTCMKGLTGPRAKLCYTWLQRGQIKGPYHGSRLGNVNRSHSRGAPQCHSHSCFYAFNPDFLF